ncbi:MAG: hypothetical protein JSV03_17180, partial [Planctomycetota bacterium]
MSFRIADTSFGLVAVLMSTATLASDIATQPSHITLTPEQGTMRCNARVSVLGGQTFSLVIPETIGCRERMLLNWPDVKARWDRPFNKIDVIFSSAANEHIRYEARLMPALDHVDIEMTVTNLSKKVWHDVWAFNCLNPTDAPAFKDWKLQRTYMSADGRPHLLANTKRV